MVNRIVLNETSYHGAGAIQEIANEAKGRGFKKAFVCSDPDLIKFNVTKKVTPVYNIMNEEKKSELDTVTIKNETLRKYFPRNRSEEHTSELQSRI